MYMTRMRFLRIIAIFLLAVAVGLNVYSKKAEYFDLDLAGIEAIADSEPSGTYLTCYCALTSDQNCAVNNMGSSVCAGGNNVHCWDYNRNCN